MPPGPPNPFRTARVAAKLTQTQVASQLGVRPATVIAWEQGAAPRGDMLDRVAELYGVGTADLQPSPLPGKVAGGEGDTLAAVGIGRGTQHTDGSVTLSAQTFGYLVGRLQSIGEMAEGTVAHVAAAARTAQAMGETLTALRGTIERAASGVQKLGQDLPALDADPRVAAAQIYAALPPKPTPTDAPRTATAPQAASASRRRRRVG